MIELEWLLKLKLHIIEFGSSPLLLTHNILMFKRETNNSCARSTISVQVSKSPAENCLSFFLQTLHYIVPKDRREDQNATQLIILVNLLLFTIMTAATTITTVKIQIILQLHFRTFNSKHFWLDVRRKIKAFKLVLSNQI